MIEDPKMAGTLGFFKFQTLLEHINEDSAMAFAKEVAAIKTRLCRFYGSCDRKQAWSEKGNIFVWYRVVQDLVQYAAACIDGV